MRCARFARGTSTTRRKEVLSYRRSGGPNGPGWDVRVVPNKFPALQVEGDLDRQGEGLFDKMNGVGAHEVIIETPDHNARWRRCLPPASSACCGRTESACST